MVGYIDVYKIGDGFPERIRSWRLRLARVSHSGDWHPRRTKDRWRRRWQAEHTGSFEVLGAVRAWTRTGAYIRMHRRIRSSP